MKLLNDLNYDYLLNILDYNPKTGIFIFKENRGKRNSPFKKGDVAGAIKSNGYRQLKINYKIYLCHRLAWFYHYGEWPKGVIDHINGNKSDNRIENLKDVTKRQNQQNRKEHRNGKLVGCSYHKYVKKWQAKITLDGKTKHLGTFETEQLAHEAYLKELNNESNNL